MGDDLPSGRQPPRFNLLESTMIPERRIDLNQNGNADERPDRQARDARERTCRDGESRPDRCTSGHRPRQPPEGRAASPVSPAVASETLSPDVRRTEWSGDRHPETGSLVIAG